MSDPFASSRRKIAWAKKNTAILNRKLGIFFRRYGGYEPFAEPHPDREGMTLIKVRFKRQFPEDFSEWVSDILANLRASLDHAVYAVSVASGKDPQPGDCCFPFGRTEEKFETSLRGRVPQELWPVIRPCKPYKGGNHALWALNAMRGMNEHATIIPTVGIGSIEETVITAKGFWSIPAQPVWDGIKHEMELATVRQGAEFKAHFKLAYSVAFGDGILRGKNVGKVLHDFAELVTLIVDRIEAESKRLGIIK
jgi:hypothetical protein